MKTTLDLPADLLQTLKQRALHEGRRLADIAAELMRQGLAHSVSPGRPGKSKIVIQANGLSVVRCASNAPAATMTAEALIAMEQASLTTEDMQRLGLAQ